MLKRLPHVGARRVVDQYFPLVEDLICFHAHKIDNLVHFEVPIVLLLEEIAEVVARPPRHMRNVDGDPEFGTPEIHSRQEKAVYNNRQHIYYEKCATEARTSESHTTKLAATMHLFAELI